MKNVCEIGQILQDHDDDGRRVVVTDHDHVDDHDFVGIRKGVGVKTRPIA